MNSSGELWTKVAPHSLFALFAKFADLTGLAEFAGSADLTGLAVLAGLAKFTGSADEEIISVLLPERFGPLQLHCFACFASLCSALRCVASHRVASLRTTLGLAPSAPIKGILQSSLHPRSYSRLIALAVRARGDSTFFDVIRGESLILAAIRRFSTLFAFIRGYSTFFAVIRVESRLLAIIPRAS